MPGQMAKPQASHKLLIGIVIGIVVGALLGGFWPAMGREVQFLGQLFLNALFLIVVPLVMASIIVGITGLGHIRKIGPIGRRTIAYYMLTTGMAVIVGIALVNIIRPGWAETEEERLNLRGAQRLPDAAYRISNNTVTLIDGEFGRSFDTERMVVLSDQGIRGVLAEKHEPGTALTVTAWTDENDASVTPKAEGRGILVDLAIAEKVKGKRDRSIGDTLKGVLFEMVPTNLFAAMAETKVLPLIFFSLIFGGVLTTLGAVGRPVIAFFTGLNEAIMKIVFLLMLTAPVGIGALIAGRLGDAGGFEAFWPDLVRLGKYAGTVIVGLLIHGVIILPLILRFFGKRPVLPFVANTLNPLVTAFSTASSSATLPVTMRASIERNKVSERSASFVLPLGATINMDGTALYEAVAAIFIAQMYGIQLGPFAMVIIFLTATLAAVGAAGIPEAGLVTMVIVLQAVGLPIEGISLILVIDWFLDRCRTTVNVWGDSVGAAVIDKMEPDAAEAEAAPAAAPA
ncbi:MAG: dicarboxylate/amino acid:cation symporter [Armatimonadetes bacterium]|nr:dicarboxylate/amino acid:cation symporter [Armatimonadota bacterium]